MSEKSRYLSSRIWLLAILLIVIVAVMVGGVFVFQNLGKDSPTNGANPPLVTPPVTSSIEDVSFPDSEEGDVLVRLSAGKAELSEEEPIPVGTGEPLTEEEIEAILARLPFLVIEPEDVVDFKLPLDSLPPPRTGEAIDVLFPPPPDAIVPDPVDAGPLEVLRFSPEGEIGLAPFVSETYNQPMVPLTTLEDLALEEIPILLEPALSGTWRWVGT